MGNRKKILIAFLASYLSECGFSVLIQQVAQQKSRLDVSDTRDLKFSLTNMQPEIEQLVGMHKLSKKLMK